MPSRDLDLRRYDSDKVSNHFLDLYDPLFAPFVDRPITLLEIGIHRGGSLLLWRDYFPRGSIVGVDLRLPEDFVPGERIRMFEGSQGDREFLSSVARETAPAGFDIIIDDASHVGELTRIAFWHLFEMHLRPGGLYAIEDWGTGYFDDWPDGRSFDLEGTLGAEPVGGHFPSHQQGLAGFIKQLVDEQGAMDASRARLLDPAGRRSRFRQMLISPGIVCVTKA